MKLSNICLFSFILCAGAGTPFAQDEVPVDRQSETRSHLPHVTPSSNGGGGGGGGGSSTAPVYATVTVTNTGPEAEEHIAVAPSNTVVVDPSTGQTFTFGPAMLVAAISDFSLRSGSNTSKYAFSLGNGGAGTWTDSFVPLDSGGFPVTSDGISWPTFTFTVSPGTTPTAFMSASLT